MENSEAVMTFNKYKQLIPVTVWLIFSLLSLWGAVVGQQEGVDTLYLVLSPYHYVGFGVIILLVVTFFFARKFFKYVAFASVLIGTFNLAIFSGSNFVIKFGSKGNLQLQPLSMLVGFMFLVINFTEIQKRVFKWSDEMQTDPRPYTIDELKAFCEKYASFSDEDLYKIRSDLKYMPVARRAAEEVLKKRKESRKAD